MSRRLGIDVGGTKCLGVVLDDAGQVVQQDRLPTPLGAEALTDVIVALVQALGGGDTIGVGLPGLVDRNGVLRAAPNLPGVVEFPAVDLLSQRLGLPVAVDNDATCATMAEWRLGAGRGVDDLVLVTLGTGIGGGLVMGGHLQPGGHGLAGEIGHMLVEVDGRPCGCGQRGCWERYASGSALADHARVMTGRRVTSEQVVQAGRSGEAWANDVIEMFSLWVARGLATLANVLDPRRIVIAGGLASVGDLLLAPVRVAYQQTVYAAAHRPLAEIVMATLGPQAGAIGAALLGAQQA